ncbi:hypothetical protein OKW43_008198 [Paraburkholderia sp. WC7.3g]
MSGAVYRLSRDDLYVLVQAMANRFEGPTIDCYVGEMSSDIYALIPHIDRISRTDPRSAAAVSLARSLLVLGRPREALFKLQAVLAGAAPATVPI